MKALAALAASLLLLAMAPRAAALGPAQPAGASSESAVPGIIELRDGKARIDVLPFCLTATERSPRDAPRQLSFRPDLSRFERAAPGAFRSYIDAEAVWLCFTVRSAASARSWLIDAGPNHGETVSLYVVDYDGGVESEILDPTQRLARGIHPPSEYAFRLTIGPGQVKTVYMRFASEGLLTVRASIWDSFEYIKTDEFDTWIVGMILGVILAVFVYTLFIAISLREGSYAYYLVYLFAFLAFVVAASGAGQAFLWPRSSWAGRRASPLFLVFMDCGIALFAREFLDIRRKSPPLSRALLAVAGLSPFLGAGLASLDLRAATTAVLYYDFAARLAVLVAALVSLRAFEGHDPKRARFFSVSYSMAFAGCVVARLGQLGFMRPLNSLWATGEEFGVLAQVLLLSYGITDAINAMRSEKEEGQRRSIELLERANKVKEDFVIGTSLEFRSPLFGIVGLVDALEGLATYRAGPEERRLSSLIKAEALRLLGSVANIAAYARLRNGDMALAAERVSLRQVIEGVAGSASHIAAGKDIAVETAVEDAEMGTDARVLEQIVYNLFADALKRSSSGIVRIEGGARGGPGGGRVRIVVSDSAPPLPEELLSRFLAPGGPSDREAVGPGLELLVARLLAERLGGSLSYSWAEGRGCFALDLPKEIRWRADGRTAPRRSIPSFLGRLTGKVGRPVSADLSETSPSAASRGLVLAYDEDPVFLEALKRYLEGRGYAVAPTLSADKAVALATSRRFDLVLLDASGQGRAGLAACSRIRAARGMDELPIVVMTDRESAEAVEAAFRAGASDYLPKLSPNELLFARVDTHVALRRAVDDALETRRRVADLEKLKTLGVLAAGVAHEVNTPNNAVIRNLPVISEVWRELSPIVKRLMDEAEGFSIRGWTAEELVRELPELIADTYSAGLQIKKIVEDLKDYARDTSSSPPEPVDLSAVAAYASRLLAPLVDRSTRRFVLDAPQGLPLARANSQKLTQVAVSILENALQSLPGPEAAVTLRTRYESAGGRVVLECEDQGSGIHPALLDKVFEPFFTTKRDAGGTGLGLSVALGIVRDAGGEIEIDSRQGRGTTVRVVLPAILETERGDDGRRD
jgi:two-component system, sensor histidine kinase LadS